MHTPHIPIAPETERVATVVTTLRPVARVLDENHPILDRESLSQEAE